jgi:hypothetical protein
MEMDELLRQAVEWTRLAGVALVPEVRQSCREHHCQVIKTILELRQQHYKEIMSWVYRPRVALP